MTNQNNEKSKNGKRLALILIALLLIVAVAFGAYTYSKYVTSQKASGTATVADWGYEVSVTNSGNADNNPFFQFYDNNSDTIEGATEKGTNTIVAGAEAGGKVAPGVSGSISFTLSGNAEVSAVVKILLAQTKDVSINFTVDSNTYTYSPVKFTLTDNKKATPDNTITGTLKEVVARFATFVNDTQLASSTGKIIPAGTPGTDLDYDFTLSWTWAFEGAAMNLNDNTGSNPLSLTAEDVNELDTLLGQKAAGIEKESVSINVTGANTPATVDYANASTEIAFTIDVSATQVQDNSTN